MEYGSVVPSRRFSIIAKASDNMGYLSLHRLSTLTDLRRFSHRAQTFSFELSWEDSGTFMLTQSRKAVK